MLPIYISLRALYAVLAVFTARIRVALYSLFQRAHGGKVCWVLCANLICAPVVEAGLNAIGQAPPSLSRLTLIVDPQLAVEIGPVEAGRRLMQYVADVNTVFARETVRRFVFDPATDIQWTFPSVATTPCGFNGLQEHEVVICISKSARGYSHSGLSLGWTFPQKGVVWNLQWTAIHDPLRLSRVVAAGAIESTERDYLARQLKTFLHELEHVFGAGSGEYYSAAAVTDSTGVVPLTNLNLANETDWYWWTRQHWRLDPLLGNVFEERRDPAANRIAILEMIRFTEGTKASINTDWSDWPKFGSSKYMAGMAAVQVRVSDRVNGVPLSGTQVSVWRDPGAGKPLIPLRTGVTDESGSYVFDADCGFSCFTLGKSTLLLKAQASGYAPAARWFTIFDAFEQKAVEGKVNPLVDLGLVPIHKADWTPPMVSLAAPSIVIVGQPTMLTATAVDNVGIQGVKVIGRERIPICTFSSAPYTCLWTPTMPGRQTVRALAIDAEGNVSVAAANVIVNAPSDVTPPVVSISAPLVAALKVRTTLVATASDDATVASLIFLVNGESVCAQKASPYVCLWVPTSSGNANIEVRAFDAMGNVSSTSTNIRVSR